MTVSGPVQRGEVRQVPVESPVVHPVADDEDVGDREPDVVEIDLHLPALDLVEEGADPEALGVAGLHVALEV